MNTPPLARHDITGLILAGGAGRRMGGLCKALQHHAGQALLAHALDRLRPQVQTVMVSTAEGNTLAGFENQGLRWVADSVGGHQGPLVGLLAGLQHCPTPWMASVPCDAPCAPRDWVERLSAALERQAPETGAAVVCTRDQGVVQMEPLFSLLHRRWAPTLAEAITQGERAPHRWLKAMGAVAVLFDDPDAFFNVNTLHDLGS